QCRLIYSQLPLAARATCRDSLQDYPSRVRTPKSASARVAGADRRRVGAMADSSSDIVSKIDRQEADNALNQAAKEIATRYDFKNTGASIAWSGEWGVEITANDEERARAVLDVFQSKLVKRGISLKAFEAGEPRQSGKDVKINGSFGQGISTEQAKKLSKLIRDEGPKGVKVQIQGDELRVSSKSRDDLQAVIALVKGADLDFAVQFTNYR